MEVASTGQTQTASAADLASVKLTENFDSFLTLLTTQLKYQDPTDPLKSSEFVNQLVQFSQVEQTIRGNKSLEQLIEIQSANQTTAALGYIGNQVEITGDLAPLVDGNAEFSYTLPEKASSTTVVIRDEAGKVVYSTAGEIKTGKHNFVWDGTINDGGTAEPGIYRITVAGKDAEGNLLSGITTTAFGIVTGVDSTQAGITLDLNGASAPLHSVLSVRRAPAT